MSKNRQSDLMRRGQTIIGRMLFISPISLLGSDMNDIDGMAGKCILYILGSNYQFDNVKTV